MKDILSRAGREVLQQFAWSNVLLAFDYDGTLAPIVPNPEAATLPETVRADLWTLARSPRVHVGVVSGRDLADLRAQVAVSEAIYAGCYGLEIEGPGMRFVHPGAQAQRASARRRPSAARSGCRYGNASAR